VNERACEVSDRDGRLASGSYDGTIRLWDPGSVSGAGPRSGKEIARLEVDAGVLSLCALPALDGKGCHLVAGDLIGRVHWLEIVE
jgi:WD40 repeat protein